MDGTWMLVEVANDEENGGSCGSHGWMEREEAAVWRVESTRVVGGCVVCVYRPEWFLATVWAGVMCADTFSYYVVVVRALPYVSHTRLFMRVFVCVCVWAQCACRSGSGASQVINASERQLWSGFTHLEISFREERQTGRTVGKGRRRRRRCFFIPCQINKSKPRAFTGIEQDSKGGGEL